MCYIWLILTVYFGLQDNLLAIVALNVVFALLSPAYLYAFKMAGYVYRVFGVTFAALSGNRDALLKEVAVFESYIYCMGYGETDSVV